MPRRRLPIVPPRTPRSTPNVFRTDTSIPRRGLIGAHVWPDTGIFLFFGTKRDWCLRFRALYGNRAKVARAIDREVRGHSTGSAASGSAADYTRRGAASVAVAELLLGGSSLPIVELEDDDLAAVDQVKAQLRGLSDDGTTKHGGEAQLIVLASKAARSTSARQIVLTNDGPASVVAAQWGLSSRHGADVLAEMSCADPNLGSQVCWAQFSSGVGISAMPASARPPDASAFACALTGTDCSACDFANAT